MSQSRTFKKDMMKWVFKVFIALECSPENFFFEGHFDAQIKNLIFLMLSFLGLSFVQYSFICSYFYEALKKRDEMTIKDTH